MTPEPWMQLPHNFNLINQSHQHVNRLTLTPYAFNIS